jgi:hypothetical protein
MVNGYDRAWIAVDVTTGKEGRNWKEKRRMLRLVQLCAIIEGN